MTGFETKDYKQWINELILTLPKGGRGQYKKLADFLNTSPTIVTQVFRGDRNLSPEQAIVAAEFFGFSKLESRYLVLLVNLARAGSAKYEAQLNAEADEMRAQARDLSKRVSTDAKLNEEAKSILYSNWYYLAIWSLVAIDGFNSPHAIAERLGLSMAKVTSTLEFLTKYYFVKELPSGQFEVGPKLLHLEPDSPHIPRHHQNWRLRAFQKYESRQAEDLFYTAPVTLSAKDARAVREQMLKFIAATVDGIKDSKSEKLYCLCLDWFEV